MRRWLIARRWWVLAVVVVLAAGLSWLELRPGGATSATTMATVTSGTYQSTVSASGTIDPKKQADLDFAVSGQVTGVLVKAGDQVRKGQGLARIDATTLHASLNSASSALTAAQTAYADDADADPSDTQLTADSAEVESARAALSSARADLRAATLRSTITGTVATVDLTVGETVGASQAQSASDSSSSSSQVTVVSAKAYVVDATVSSSDVTSLKKGLQARITPDGASSTVYGTVASVGRVAEVSSSGAADFPVVIDVTGSPKGLYAGTSANVSIIVKQATNVLAVPSAALHTSGSTTYVLKMVNGRPVRTTVKPGTAYGIETRVLSGLKAGDRVEMPSFGGFTRTATSGNGGRGFTGRGFGGGLPNGGGFLSGGGN
ncbi:MAG: efflux RND transporter periplasmic adaptor subunit [Sciscionella sp.]